LAIDDQRQARGGGQSALIVSNVAITIDLSVELPRSLTATSAAATGGSKSSELDEVCFDPVIGSPEITSRAIWAGSMPQLRTRSRHRRAAILRNEIVPT